MSKSTSFLYQLARAANDIEKLASGDPKRIARRAKNKYVGRKLIRKAWNSHSTVNGRRNIGRLLRLTFPVKIVYKETMRVT